MTNSDFDIEIIERCYESYCQRQNLRKYGFLETSKVLTTRIEETEIFGKIENYGKTI